MNYERVYLKDGHLVTMDSMFLFIGACVLIGITFIILLWPRRKGFRRTKK